MNRYCAMVKSATRARLWIGVLGVMTMSAAGALAQDAGAAPAKPDAQPAAEQPSTEGLEGVQKFLASRFTIGKIELRYQKAVDGQPAIEELAQTQVVLSKNADGSYGPPVKDSPNNVAITIGTGFEPAAQVSGSGIAEIAKAINRALNERGVLGTIVEPDADQIDPFSFDDKRNGESTLKIVLWTSTIDQVRTIANGTRLDPSEERIDSELHTRILNNSPLQPGGLINGDELTAYVYRLNRHPGRRVDVAIGPALKTKDDPNYDPDKLQSEPGKATLDYLVTENKPWYLYAQVSNTGTRETSQWRERIGFTHNQVTNNDDVFRLDYLTANFQDTNALLASYERPIYGDRLRGKIYGQASEFTASDVGALRQNFTGESWQAGGELSYNIFQHREMFIDLIGGARWQNVHLRNEIVQGFAIRGTENFFIPYGGVRFSRDTGTSTTTISTTLEQSVSSIGGSDNDSFSAQIKKLGRLNPNNDWTLLKFEGEQSFYLEPILNMWGGDYKTLAHELAFSFRGQYAFGARLIPTESFTVGGLYTVRGYRESTVSGDSAIVGSAEYRFHLPRMLSIQPETSDTLFGQPFRWHPGTEFGRPDWDLILRAFFDAGATNVSDRSGREANETLMSTGLGVDFQIKNNISLRLDWGIPITTVDSIDDPINSGESRLHFVATFVY